MTSGDESGIREKLEALSNEVDKVEKGLAGFKNIYELKAEKYLDSLSNLIIEIQSGNSGSCLSPEIKVKICSLLSNVKSNFSDALKKHRDIHACISKFKKSIDKVRFFLSWSPAS